MLIDKDDEAFYLQCTVSMDPQYRESFFSFKRYERCQCLGFLPMEIDEGAQGVIEPLVNGKHYVMILLNEQGLLLAKGIRRNAVILPHDREKVLSGELRLLATGTNKIKIVTKDGNVHSV